MIDVDQSDAGRGLGEDEIHLGPGRDVGPALEVREPARDNDADLVGQAIPQAPVGIRLTRAELVDDLGQRGDVVEGDPDPPCGALAHGAMRTVIADLAVDKLDVLAQRPAAFLEDGDFRDRVRRGLGSIADDLVHVGWSELLDVGV